MELFEDESIHNLLNRKSNLSKKILTTKIIYQIFKKFLGYLID